LQIFTAQKFPLARIFRAHAIRAAGARNVLSRASAIHCRHSERKYGAATHRRPFWPHCRLIAMVHRK
jgi:hypothetical protein